jgi:type I restriction enzyme M protein
MANPPFNVDLVDAERIKSDLRLPFGLPGVNKEKKVSNGNYLWISYFWSYLNEQGRAGFVMSSQASSAGHGEKEVRKKIVETGDVDVIISIRSNFFYTRSVPCELWFFDRGKPTERKDQVLMLDARQVYRKVTRKIYDFSPEHMQTSRPLSGSTGDSSTASWRWYGTTSVPSALRAQPSRQSSLPSRRRLLTCAAVSQGSCRR